MKNIKPADEYAIGNNAHSHGKLRKQKRQDYIQNNPIPGKQGNKRIEVNPYDDYYNVRLEANNHEADIKWIDEFDDNAYLFLKNSNNSSPEGAKILYKGRHQGENSDDKINYDQAFEEMKFEIERHNYIQSKYRNKIADVSNSQENYDEIYENYLDNNINSPYLENDQTSGHSSELNNNDLMLKDVDASDVANEVVEEYNKNEGISIPVSSKTAWREEHDIIRNEATTPYRQLDNPGSSTNTITKAITNLRSIESSESIIRSPIWVLKTYVINKSRKLISHLNQSEKEWAYWIKQKRINREDLLQSQINKNLSKKYMTSKDFYNVKIINDIIYNENTHIVSVFKDYLILDDISEFLKRSYANFETKPRLIKIYEFYDKYSKVFPNYVVLPESKYMFKNIERKQRMIDEKQKYKTEQEKRLKVKDEKKNKNFDGFSDLLDSSESVDKIFNTKFIDSMNKASPHKLDHSNTLDGSKLSQFEEHKMQSSSISQHSQIYKQGVVSKQEQMNEIWNQSGIKNQWNEVPLDELIEQFLERDSEILSNTSIDNCVSVEENKNESDNKNLKRRKVKRVDYTLKLTSNDIERNHPNKNSGK